MNVIISQENSWSQKLFEKLKIKYPSFIWVKECNLQILDALSPKWVFFFHWSKIVPKEIYQKYKCVVIHTGRLPKDRGGSPLQNQILKGITHTRVNAIEMEKKVDSGAIYHSIPITLQGNITDIWLSIADTAYKLINYCIISNPKPIPQNGTPQVYKRIQNNKVEFDPLKNISYVYDQIRMVDDMNYPDAYLDINGYRLEFSRAKLENNQIITDVKIKKQ